MYIKAEMGMAGLSLHRNTLQAKANYDVQQVLLKQGDGGVVTATLGINKTWVAS